MSLKNQRMPKNQQVAVEPEVDVNVVTTVQELYTVLGLCNVIEEGIADKDAKLKTREAIALRGFVTRSIQPALESYQSKVQTINTRHCKLDKDGCIIYDEKDRLKFTPEQDEKRREMIEKAKKDVVTLKLYKITEVDDLPKDLLGDYEYELLYKFLIFGS